MIPFSHRPVLLEECMEGLAPERGGVYFDGTAGGGGHSYEILRRSAPQGRLIATDLDENAIAAAENRLAPFAGRFRIRHANFKQFESVLNEEGVNGLDGVMLDLGVSSFQLDEASRGFSYLKDAPLDMRMDAGSGMTAEDVVNGYSEERLGRLLWEYGEERFAKRIARAIAERRKTKRITRTGELAQIVESGIPAKFRRNGPCARKTFQAIRIEVNGELSGLAEAVKGLALRLNKGGRICVLTFHSLEDRIVKNVFRELAEGCTCDKSLPVCVCGKKQEINILTKKPVTAGEEELRENPRSKSAKLRIAERIGEYS